MIVETMWGLRRGEQVPELMVAWDEFSVDSYSDGWREACEKARESWGRDLLEFRYVKIDVDEDAIEKAFRPSTIQGDVRV